MVLIKNLTQPQINSADNFKGEVITNADTNKLMFNTGTQFTYLVYSDLNNVITGLSGISATNITGTLQTAAQPNITSLGALNGLTVNNNLVVADHNGVDEGLTLGGDLVTSTADEINYLSGVTVGTATAGKALVTDSNNSIVGLTNLETDNLTVNGTLVTSSAIELNYVDVDTLGQAFPNKALVLDANKDIVGINTLEADYIKVNGTLVTSSAIELNYVDVNTLGTAEGSKALVVDANRDIGNIRNLTAENLTGTLQTAAQPNVTSLGDLTDLTVTGHTDLNSLSVNGVPLDAFNLGGLKMRVYSNTDFTGRVIKADIVDDINFTNYVPATGITENYSMEIWGYIKPLYTENYIFTISSNDKFRLWINNELVKVAWTEGTHTELQTNAIALTANAWYPIYIQHAQITGTEDFSINWSSTTQVNGLLPSTSLAYDDKILNIISKKTYTQDSINLYDGVNSNISTISTTATGDLVFNSFSNFVDVSDHNGVDAGLKLGGTLITSTAAELNYVDTTTGSVEALKAVVVDLNKDTSGIRNITTVGSIGINSSAPSKQMEINSSTGDVLRLTRDNTNGTATNYADMTIDATGKLTINSSGDETIIHSSDNFNISGHNGSTVGLKLNNVLVTATANEINYVDTTAGTAEASKALVLDASRNISNVNSFSTSTLTSISTTESTSTTTGAIITAGGVGIAKNVNVGGVVEVLNTTNATNSDSGALIISGGAGVKKALYVGEDSTPSVVVNPDGFVLGTSWTNRSSTVSTILDQTWRAIDWSPALNMYVAISGSYSMSNETYTTSNILTSADGISWTSRTSINHDWYDIKWVTYLNKFVAIGKAHAGINENDEPDYVKFVAMSSADGIAWTEFTNPTTVDGQTHSLYDNTIKFSMEFNNNIMVVVGGSLALVSTDGNSWTETRFTNKNYKDIAWSQSQSRFVAVGFDSNVGYTNNGTVWTHDTLPETGESVNTIAWSSDLSKFVALSGAFYFSSSNGTSWTATALNNPQFGIWNGLKWISSLSKFFAVGENTRLAITSSNGTAWTTLAGNLNTSYVDFTYSETLKRAVAISLNDNDVRLAYSDDTSFITTAGGASDGYFNLKGDADITGGIDVEGIVNMNNTTQSTTTSSGALVVDGGVGIAKNLNVGQTLEVDGDVSLNANVVVDGPSLRLPVGNTTARPVGVLGQVRYNSETSQFEGFGAGNNWGSLGGVSDVDQDTRISAETSAGADNDELRFYNAGSESLRLTSTGLMGLGTTTPSKKLEINSSTGDALRMTYNDADGSAVNYVDMTVSSDGKLTINSSGDETIIHSSDNFNISGHNGSTLGLKLNNVLVTATANELNYVDTTAGTAEASKALVLDASRNISNVNNFTSTGNLLATGSATTSNLLLSSLDNDDYASFKVDSNYILQQTNTGFQWNTGADSVSAGTKIMELDTTLSITVPQENKNTTESTSTTTGAVIVDGGVGIAKNLNVGGDVLLSGDLSVVGPSLKVPVGDTSERPTGALGQIRYNDETSQFEGFGAGNTWGSLGGVSDVDQDTRISAETAAGDDNDELRFYNAGNESMRITNTGLIGLGTSAPSKKLEINSATGDVLRMTYNDTDGSAVNYVDMTVNESGFLTIDSSGNEVNIHSSDNFNITGHNGTTKGLKLNGELVTATATELNYVDTTAGTAEASKALILDVSRNISNVNEISTSSLVSVSTVDSTSTATGAITTAGGVGVAKNLNVGGITKISNLTNSTDITNGALIVSGGVGIQKSLYIGSDADGPTDGYLCLTGNADIFGDLGVSGVIQMNNTTESTSITTGALVVDGGVGVAKNLNVGGAVNITGSTTMNSNVVVEGPSLRIPVGDTSERPVGVLGQIRYNDETSQFEGFGAGNSWGSLGGVTDVDQDTRISAETAAGDDNDELRFYNAGNENMRLTSTGLMGLGTTTPSKKLEINSSTGDVLRLTYDDANGSAVNFVDMNVSTDGKLTINSSGDETIIHSSDNFNVSGHNGSTVGLKLNSVLVTATATELNYVDTTPGAAEASKALVLDASRDINNINVLTADTINVSTFGAEDLTAENINTTGNVGINTSDLTFGLQINEATGNVLRLTYNDSTTNAPTSKADFTMDNGNNLTISASNSVNIATHNGTDKGLKLNNVLVTATANELNYVDTTAGTAEASKALVLDANRDITNINSISMSSLNLTYDSAVVDTVGAPLTISRITSGAPANGLGVGMAFKIENSANANVEFGNINVVSTDITASSEDGQFVVNLMTNGVMTESLRLNSTTLFTNELYETSDKRVKENFTPISLQETHEKVMSLELVDYNYIGQEKIHRGVIAQQVEQIIPSAVESTDKNGFADFKTVSTREISNHMLGSIQYLSSKLDEMMAKFNELSEEFKAYKLTHP